jgi:hypothetical protein
MTTTNLTQASDQWATRPDDERFWTLEEMYSQTRAYAQAAEEVPRLAKDCRVSYDAHGIVMEAGPDDYVDLGHYAFTQVCRSLNAPASYMRTLPPELVVRCLEQSRGQIEDDERDRMLLIDRSGERSRLRATTSARYARVWNYEIIERLLGLQSEGWVVPAARPSGNESASRLRIATADDVVDYGSSNPLTVKIGDTIAPSGLYASDHDMFAFLIHPERVIDNGTETGMRRGTMIRQSEVGQSSIVKLDFLFDTVCGNHIVWDARDIRETRVRHLGSQVEDSWVALIREISDGAEAAAADDEARIRQAQEMILADTKDDVLDLLFKQRWATKRVASKAFDLAEEHSDVHGDPRSLWGMVSGMTRLSQDTGYADERTALDRAAGKMLAAALN